MRDQDYYRSRKNGLLYFRVTPKSGGRRVGVCTGQRTVPLAKRAVANTGLDRLQSLAESKAVTAKAIEIITGQAVVMMRDVGKEWERWMLAVKAPNTAKSYAGFVQAMIRDLKCDALPVGELTEVDIDRWVNRGEQRQSTVQLKLAAIRSFYRYANAKGATTMNPAMLVTVKYRDMAMAQLEPHCKIPFTEEEYLRLLATLSGNWRDWVVLAYCTGLRICDCIMLERDSISATQMVVYPSKGRGKRLAMSLEDPLIFRPELREVIERLCAKVERGTWCYPKDRVEFMTFGAKFSSDFKKMARNVGIPDKTFHCLRHSFAQRLRAAGKTIEEVARNMGHGSIEVTKGYTGDK